VKGSNGFSACGISAGTLESWRSLLVARDPLACRLHHSFALFAPMPQASKE
jgi:hypothetical protein